MKKVIRLTESDLTRIVRRVIIEDIQGMGGHGDFSIGESEEGVTGRYDNEKKWLESDGWLTSKSGGKYELYAEDFDDRIPPYMFVITSQEGGGLDLSVYMANKRDRMKADRLLGSRRLKKVNNREGFIRQINTLISDIKKNKK